MALLHLSEPAVFFHHVPKCGGTTVSQSLRPHMRFPAELVAADLGLPQGEVPPQDYRHPELGLIKLNHLPLGFIADLLPRTWALLRASSSFAMVRAPRDRFVSAVLQRLREYGRMGASQVTDEAIRGEAARVCDWLSRRGTFCTAEYVHFARQSGFVEHEGAVVHDRVFALERLPDLYAWLHAEHGFPLIEPEAKRIGRRPRGWMRAVHPIARYSARRLMPDRLREAVYPLWLRSGAFVRTSSGYDALDLGADVEAFVEAYYGRDRELHRAVSGDGRFDPCEDAVPQEARPGPSRAVP